MALVLQKTIALVLAVWLTATLTFFALQVLPGDPAVLVLGTEGDPASLELLREQMGLNVSLGQRYLTWLKDLVRWDLGMSIRYSRAVTDLIGDALPITFVLAVLAVGLAILVGIPTGVLTAVYRDSWGAALAAAVTHLGMAVPSFWLGILLMQWLAVDRGWFPAGGYADPGERGWLATLLSLTLPAITLALPRAAILTRMVRASMLQVLQEDYIRTARSKGLSAWLVYFKHGFRGAALNTATTAAIQLTQLLVGTIIVEQVFSLPGLGRLLLAAVTQRDLPLVQGLVVMGGVSIVLFHYGFDLLLARLDPRIRYD